jgi:S1-C subfamily serine protease
MKFQGTICLTLFALSSFMTVRAQGGSMTSKEIYDKYSHAVVEVQVGSGFGTGFIVSNTGLILTANHVVAPAPNPNAYASAISVKLFDGRVVNAKPVLSAPSADSLAHHYALLKISPVVGPTFEIGAWNEVSPGDTLTTMGFALQPESPLLLTAVVSGLFRGPPSNIILFQGPANKGLSGGPLISNSSGKVIGIVTNKLAGITKELDETRNQIIQSTSGQNGVTMTIKMAGMDPLKATLDLINVLDQYLISGMGVAISIEYAKTAATSAQ